MQAYESRVFYQSFTNPPYMELLSNRSELVAHHLLALVRRTNVAVM